MSCTHHYMFRFVSLRRKVQVMRDIVILFRSGKRDLQVKFSPSLLLDSERRIRERC